MIAKIQQSYLIYWFRIYRIKSYIFNIKIILLTITIYIKSLNVTIFDVLTQELGFIIKHITAYYSKTSTNICLKYNFFC